MKNPGLITSIILLLAVAVFSYVGQIMPGLDEIRCVVEDAANCEVAYPDTEPVPRLYPFVQLFVLTTLIFLVLFQSGNIATFPLLLLVWATGGMFGENEAFTAFWILLGAMAVTITAAIPHTLNSTGGRALASISHIFAIALWTTWAPGLEAAPDDLAFFQDFIVWLMLPAALLIAPIAWGVRTKVKTGRFSDFEGVKATMRRRK